MFLRLIKNIDGSSYGPKEFRRVPYNGFCVAQHCYALFWNHGIPVVSVYKLDMMAGCNLNSPRPLVWDLTFFKEIPSTGPLV